MKKLIIVISLMLCLFMSACTKTETNNISVTKTEIKYNVTIDIECVENLFFSRYDVNVLVDSKKIATLEHGSQATYNIELTEGEHILTLEKEDENKTDGNATFNISSDTALKYKISCTNDQIKIEELEKIEDVTEKSKTDNLETNNDDKTVNTETKDENINPEDTEVKKEEPVLKETQAKIPQSSYMYSSDNYQEVINELTRAGFTNIKTEMIYDVGTGWWASLSKDQVKTISVNGKTEFEEGEIFEKNCEIIITYCDLKINDPNIQYKPYTVAKLIQDLEANAMNAKDTHTDEYVAITGRIESINENGKNFYLYPSNNAWAIQGVLCDVQTDEQKEKLKNYVSGNIVTIKGQITLVGDVLGYSMDVYSIP